MVDTFKNSHNILIRLRLRDVEDCTCNYRFTKFQLNFKGFIKATIQCFELWKSAIMDQSVTFRKRVYKERYEFLTVTLVRDSDSPIKRLGKLIEISRANSHLDGQVQDLKSKKSYEDVKGFTQG